MVDQPVTGDTRFNDTQTGTQTGSDLAGNDLGSLGGAGAGAGVYGADTTVASTSPGETFVTGSDREGFGNQPQISIDDRIEERSSLDRTGGRSGYSAIGTRVKEYGNQVFDRVKSVDYKQYAAPVADKAKLYSGQVDTQVRTYPWYAIGVAGVASLFLGYAIGRSMTKRRVDVVEVDGLGVAGFEDALQ